jgi:hypothetical protein
MREHGIVGLVADKTLDVPAIDDLMVRLDHPSGMIPFYAVFPGKGGPVITYKEGPLWQSLLLDMLKEAQPSGTSDPMTASSPGTSKPEAETPAAPVARGTQGSGSPPR